MKHRGTHHISGIGENPHHILVPVNGNCFPIIAHREFNVEEWTKKLIRFHRKLLF